MCACACACVCVRATALECVRDERLEKMDGRSGGGVRQLHLIQYMQLLAEGVYMIS